MLLKSEILLIGINFDKILAQLAKDMFIITRNWKQHKCCYLK